MTAYRVGRTYGVHVYQGNRPVATFFDADEAAAFVAAVNGANYADVTHVALGATDGLEGAQIGTGTARTGNVAKVEGER